MSDLLNQEDPSDFVAQLRDGDEKAFEALVDRYHGPMLRLAQSFVPAHAVAEEVVQETWLAVLNGLDGFTGRSSLKTWIFRILTNRAKTRGIRERRGVPFSALEEAGGDEPSVEETRFKANGRWLHPPTAWATTTPEESLVTREGLTQLEAALADLPAHQRAVVTLRDVEGLDASEVCNILDIAETNQRVLLHRGRSKLRALLERSMALPQAPGSGR